MRTYAMNIFELNQRDLNQLNDLLHRHTIRLRRGLRLAASDSDVRRVNDLSRELVFVAGLQQRVLGCLPE